MTSTATVPASTTKASSKRSFDGMSPQDLINELKARDTLIAELQKECKRLKTSAAPMVSPAKAEERAAQLKKIALKGIKSQMKWKPSCKHGTARWSFSALCDEPTFRAFMGLEPKDKTKGGKIKIEDFENMLESSISASIRYGSLYLRNEHVNISFKQSEGEIKITGAYGM